MSAAAARLGERVTWRLIGAADALCNRVYGQRFNPLYQSGTIVVALYLVVVVTGLWLILFYRVGAPWESVAGLAADRWVGSWARGVHRYASDLALVATAVHALRMFAQARSAGPRTLAWISGCVLLVLLLVCGWTGYVMVWDTFGEHLAREGARMLDALPFLSEPTSRAFTGEQPLPTAFFFLSLFAHVGIPLAMAAGFLLHVKRVARPVLLPPTPVIWLTVAALMATAIVWPPPLAPQANALVLAPQVPADFFFAFWIPLTRGMSGGAVLLWSAGLAAGLLIVPLVTARRGAAARLPSAVDPDLCVGCDQCSLDCPYGAITMVDRADGRSDRLARVDPNLCVSCGICAGSCSPMGIGPPGRSGRDQLSRVRAFLADHRRRAGDIVVVCCAHGAAAFADEIAGQGAISYPVDCAGSVHTSVIELLLRGGVAGVLVLACPPRDCWNREGPRWLVERVYEGREAELHDRVTRARVAIVNVGARERARALEAVRHFAGEVAALGQSPRTDVSDVDRECEPALAERVP